MIDLERWMLNVHIALIYNRLPTIWYCCFKDYALHFAQCKGVHREMLFTSSLNALAHRGYFSKTAPSI